MLGLVPPGVHQHGVGGVPAPHIYHIQWVRYLRVYTTHTCWVRYLRVYTSTASPVYGSGLQPRGPLRGVRELYLTQLTGIGNAHWHRSARAPPQDEVGGDPWGTVLEYLPNT